jgi:hypothetical protein
MSNTILSIPEALVMQRQKFGRVVVGRDCLYAAARLGCVPVIRNQRRVYFPLASLEKLLSGEVQLPTSKAK